MVVLVAVLAFPFVLLGLLLAMERVEAGLRVDDVAVRLPRALDVAAPDELETLVRDGFGPALERYWRRRRTRVVTVRRPA